MPVGHLLPPIFSAGPQGLAKGPKGMHSDVACCRCGAGMQLMHHLPADARGLLVSAKGGCRGMHGWAGSLVNWVAGGAGRVGGEDMVASRALARTGRA
eukprot:881458-Pelagomonas_calceolata.AAC.1